MKGDTKYDEWVKIVFTLRKCLVWERTEFVLDPSHTVSGFAVDDG